MKHPLEDNSSVIKFQKELNAGTIGLVVLAVLDRCGEMYGYEIVRQLTDADDDALPMNQSAVYPVLRSLEKQNLLDSRMQPSAIGPARKYYRLTSEGLAVFRYWKQAWTRSVTIVNRILTENSNVQSVRSASRNRKVSS